MPRGKSKRRMTKWEKKKAAARKELGWDEPTDSSFSDYSMESTSSSSSSNDEEQSHRTGKKKGSKKVGSVAGKQGGGVSATTTKSTVDVE